MEFEKLIRRKVENFFVEVLRVGRNERSVVVDGHVRQGGVICRMA